MQLILPQACVTSQEGWMTLAQVYDAREHTASAVWAKLVLASCHEQLAVLCAAYNAYMGNGNRPEDVDVINTLYIGAKQGMFIDLVRIVSHDDKVAKRARALFHSLLTGFVAGRKYQETIRGDVP